MLAFLKSIGLWLLARLFGGQAAIEAQQKEDAAAVAVQGAQANAQAAVEAAKVEAEILKEQEAIREKYNHQQDDPLNPFHNNEWNSNK